jgi:hypothetical protein
MELILIVYKPTVQSNFINLRPPTINKTPSFNKKDKKKLVITINKNPTYSEYQKIYENLKGNLNSISNELLTITSDVEQNTKNIGDFLLKINESIEKEKDKNSKLKSIESNINNSYNGSRVMINEYKETYNSKYYNNIFIFIGIIISTTALIKIFTNRNVV